VGFNRAKYFIEEAATGVARNSLMSVSSALTVSCCMLILIFSYSLAANVDYFLEQIENKSGITAFVDDALSDAGAERLRLQIAAEPNVATVTLITKERALEIMADKETGAAKDLIESLRDDNPLPRSFEITLLNGADHDTTLAALNALIGKGIYRVNADSATVGALVLFNNVVRVVSVFVVLLLGFLSVVIIMNTIKLTVNARKTDINIMKYVGATDWFIKWPFIIEGVIIGLFGALIPVVIFAFGYGPLVDGVKSALGSFATLLKFKDGMDIFVFAAPVILSAGVIVGVAGSSFSIRRYLRV
jgi:cell division transport system permease protein